MEDFLSKDERPKDLCLKMVKKCDLYVGIFAHQCGHIPKRDSQSITEQEYRCARASGIECLIFIIKEDSPWQKSGENAATLCVDYILSAVSRWTGIPAVMAKEVS